MKRIIKGLIVSLLIVFLGGNMVSANDEAEEPLSEERVLELIGEEDGTLEWWYNYWELTDEYPDNVSYVRQQTASTIYEIGLVENTSEAQEDFMEFIPNTPSVTFEEASYSYNELRAVQNEVNQQYLEVDDEAVIGTAIGPGYLLVSVDEGEGYEYQQLLRSEFGDMIYIEEMDFSPATEGGDDSGIFSIFDQSQEESVSDMEDSTEESAEEIITFEDEETFDTETDMDMAEDESDLAVEESESVEEDSEEVASDDSGTLLLDIPEYEEYEAVEYSPYVSEDNSYLPLVVMLACVTLAGGGYIVYRNRRLQEQTVEGEQVEGSVISKEETESRIKESSFEPSEEVYQAILDKLEE